jgi:hypothetical protein
MENMKLFLLFLFQVQAPQTALENDYVRVSRDAAPCASAAAPGCGVRIIVALGDFDLRSDSATLTKLKRGGVAVFEAGKSYEPPKGSFFEVAIKPNHPAVESPPEIIPAENNSLLYDGKEFFIFEERLGVGETRVRHSHNQRVVIQLNRTQLRQWPDGQPVVVRDIEPDRPSFNPPVIHKVENVGKLPLRGIVIELKANGVRRPPGER